ncbi:MAG: YhgE/Pip family protein, partial [Bacillota bacterium]
FTYNMLHLQEALKSDEPSLTYYTNAKKNAAAAKITDSAAGTLLDKINTRYLEAVFDQIFKDTNKLSDKLDSKEATEEALNQLKETRDALSAFNESISLLSSSSAGIQNSLNSAEKTLDKARSKADSDLSKAQASIKAAKETLKKLKNSLNEEVSALDDEIKKLEDIIEEMLNAGDEEQIREIAERVKEQAETVLTALKELRSLIPDTSQSYAARIVCDTIDLMILQTEEIINLIDEDPVSNAKAIEEAIRSLVNMGDSDLKPAIDNLISDFERAIRIAKPLLSATGGMLDNIDPVLDSAGGTVKGLDSTSLRLQVVLTSLQEELDDIIAQVEAADEDDRMGLLTGLMGGDPDEYSKFFSSLVHVDKHEIYPVRFYGSAMAPFYSILAIWVGGVMLIGLFSTHANRRKYPQLTESQGFFGRFLIFALIGQLQAAVIVAGDIFLLHCEPVHPVLMWVSAAVTSLVFVMLIYAMTLSFGIVGKAAVVVIMVLQIAGSSGSYPIEILPEIFDKIYRFFPFPYGINAMREAICGVYGNDFIIYLAELLVFGVLGLAIGLLVRKPFIGVNRYMTEKLEETEVL